LFEQFRTASARRKIHPNHYPRLQRSNRTPIPVHGGGSNIRDWLYVDDHCVGISAVLRNGRLGETYNIGDGNEQHNIDIVKLICRLMDQIKPDGAPHDKLISFVPDRLGHDWHYAIDASKLTQELGWMRAARFEEEMRSTITWLLAAS
jgi:dTDP-glucose 4,6-dehydratase